MHRHTCVLAIAFSGLLVTACGPPGVSSSVSPGLSTSPQPTSAPPHPTVGATSSEATDSSQPPFSRPAVVLRSNPPDLGCDAVPPPYSSITFHIDAKADEQVYATSDTGVTLRTYWAPGFTASEAGVEDTGGSIVARDGDVLAMPVRGWPRLGGHFVCPGPSAVYVFLTDPQ